MGSELLGIFFGLGLIGTIIGGSICGIVACVRAALLKRELSRLEQQINTLKDLVRSRPAGPAPVPSPEEEASLRAPKPAAPVEVRTTQPPAVEPAERVPSPAIEPAGPPPPLPKVVLPPPMPPAPKHPSFEHLIGTKWAGYVGAVMVVIGIAYGIKYAYDNNWIGPQGRLAIGVFLGIAALGAAEHFRRRNWLPLFQTLTGVGIAIFYICVFFSFQVYHLSGQGTAFGLAILVTLLAIVMAVAHDAIAIAILGVVGGFLSPVLLSTQENHPHALFIFIALLDLVALGAAYFRRWRLLDLLCFLGTVAMYMAWYWKFYAPDQLPPALIYLSVFYLLFLLVPTVHSLVRRLPETLEGLALVVLNAAFSFGCYYTISFKDHRYALGFVTLGQALLVFLLFHVWTLRVRRVDRTGESLLVIALALVTVAVPIQLKLYGIPIAWALEGVLFLYLGIRFNKLTCRIAGYAALLLAVGGLLHRLPLHAARFLPVFNVPFGSWTVVIAAAWITAYLLHRAGATTSPEAGGGQDLPFGAIPSFLLGFALSCALLTLEVCDYWRLSGGEFWRMRLFSSVGLLWAIIPAATTGFIVRRGERKWLPLGWACCVVSVCVFISGLPYYGSYPPKLLFLNVAFIPSVLIIAVIWLVGIASHRLQYPEARTVADITGNALLLVLLAVEIHRWSRHADWISERMGMGLISAAWACQALALVWFGLVVRSRPVRIMGFAVFGAAILKAFLVDMQGLEQVYRIVSFLATGVLLLTATYFYHRYSRFLLQKPEEETKEDRAS